MFELFHYELYSLVDTKLPDFQTKLPTQNFRIILKEFSEVQNGQTFLVNEEQSIRDLFVYALLLEMLEQPMGELEYRVAWMPQIMSEAPDEQRVIFIIELLPVLLLLDLDVLCDVNHVEDQSSFVIPFDILAKGSEE